jgi:hypothetical protein
MVQVPFVGWKSNKPASYWKVYYTELHIGSTPKFSLYISRQLIKFSIGGQKREDVGRDVTAGEIKA